MSENMPVQPLLPSPETEQGPDGARALIPEVGVPAQAAVNAWDMQAVADRITEERQSGGHDESWAWDENGNGGQGDFRLSARFPVELMPAARPARPGDGQVVESASAPEAGNGVSNNEAAEAPVADAELRDVIASLPGELDSKYGTSHTGTELNKALPIILESGEVSTAEVDALKAVASDPHRFATLAGQLLDHASNSVLWRCMEALESQGVSPDGVAFRLLNRGALDDLTDLRHLTRLSQDMRYEIGMALLHQGRRDTARNLSQYTGVRVDDSPSEADSWRDFYRNSGGR